MMLQTVGIQVTSAVGDGAVDGNKPFLIPGLLP